MSKPFVQTLPLSSMDLLRINHTVGVGGELYENPDYSFRKEGDFHYSLRVKDRSGAGLLEIFFMESDMVDFIMRAEMALRNKEG